jgi:hypothetical protein
MPDDFLADILQLKEARLTSAMERVPLPALRKAANQASPARSLRAALTRASTGGNPNLIVLKTGGKRA